MFSLSYRHCRLHQVWLLWLDPSPSSAEYCSTDWLCCGFLGHSFIEKHLVCLPFWAFIGSQHSCTVFFVDMFYPCGSYQGHSCWVTWEVCVLFCEKPPNYPPKVTYHLVFSSAVDVPSASHPGQHLAAVFLISVILTDMSVEVDGIVMLICSHWTNMVLNSSHVSTACHLCVFWWGHC